MPPVIRVENLVKEFRRPRKQEGRFGAIRTLFTRQFDSVRAVDQVNFAIEPGELVGYIGPNGAGKSTTIKMMTGILVPTSGTVEVGGLVPWRERERNAMQIGVVFGQRSQLWWDLPLIESFNLIAKLYRVPDAKYDATSTASSRYSTWRSFSSDRYANSASASACAATWRRPCSTNRRFSTSTSRPSASMSSPKRTCASSSKR